MGWPCVRRTPKALKVRFSDLVCQARVLCAWHEHYPAQGGVLTPARVSGEICIACHTQCMHSLVLARVGLGAPSVLPHDASDACADLNALCAGQPLQQASAFDEPAPEFSDAEDIADEPAAAAASTTKVHGTVQHRWQKSPSRAACTAEHALSRLQNAQKSSSGSTQSDVAYSSAASTSVHLSRDRSPRRVMASASDAEQGQAHAQWQTYDPAMWHDAFDPSQSGYFDDGSPVRIDSTAAAATGAASASASPAPAGPSEAQDASQQCAALAGAVDAAASHLLPQEGRTYQSQEINLASAMQGLAPFATLPYPQLNAAGEQLPPHLAQQVAEVQRDQLFDQLHAGEEEVKEMLRQLRRQLAAARRRKDMASVDDFNDQVRLPINIWFD